MKRLMFFLMLWVFLVSSSCKKEPPPEFLYGIPFTFQFRLLNEAGKETTTFLQGQNITFDLQMTNYSSNRWDLISSRFFGTPNYLRVFKIVNTTDSLDVGQPFDSNAWCSSEDVFIKSNETINIKFNWTSDSTQFPSKGCGIRGANRAKLSTGKYKTGFTTRFQFFEGDSFRISKPVRLDVDFEVK
jgi:hypothetical protein